MKLYIKQRVISLIDRFSIYDENGQAIYNVEGEFPSLGKRLHLYDLSGQRLMTVHHNLLSLRPKYDIFRGNRKVAEIIKEITLLKASYTVKGIGWKVSGDYSNHEYDIRFGCLTVASVSKKWFTLGDAFEIDLEENADVPLALAVVLVIDACLDNR